MSRHSCARPNTEDSHTVRVDRVDMLQTVVELCCPGASLGVGGGGGGGEGAVCGSLLFLCGFSCLVRLEKQAFKPVYRFHIYPSIHPSLPAPSLSTLGSQGSAGASM